MKPRSILATTCLVLALGITTQAQSLGDVAREYRQTRPTTAPAKVYDNDNLPKEGAISVLGPPPAPATADKDAKAADKSEGEKSAGKKPLTEEEKAKTEAEAQKAAQQQVTDAVGAQQKKIADLEQQLDLLQREYRLRASVYYADVGTQLRAPQLWAQQEQKFRDDIASTQQKLDEAKAKLVDLQETARKVGLPSSTVE